MEVAEIAENNTSNIGFEKQIWDAACVLRGNIDASEYKSVVLGLIFLKYISDRFEAKYKELVEEGDGFEEDQDEYTAENIFFVPENARCRDFMNNTTIDIVKELTDLLRKNQTIDWQKKESARAGMRRLVKRLLKKHKYPPEGMDDAVQTVMSQCDMWTDNVMTA